MLGASLVPLCGRAPEAADRRSYRPSSDSTICHPPLFATTTHGIQWATSGALLTVLSLPKTTDEQ